jgi:hypothetical protein
MADDRRRRVLHLPTACFPQTRRRKRGDEQEQNGPDCFIRCWDTADGFVQSSYQEQIANGGGIRSHRFAMPRPCGIRAIIIDLARDSLTATWFRNSQMMGDTSQKLVRMHVHPEYMDAASQSRTIEPPWSKYSSGDKNKVCSFFYVQVQHLTWYTSRISSTDTRKSSMCVNQRPWRLHIFVACCTTFFLISRCHFS